MDSNNSAIIKPSHVFDFGLFAKIIPGVQVGERFMRLDTIEEASYQETGSVETEDQDVQLAISHSSGCVYFFDDDEERELEDQIKATIKRSEDAQVKAKQEQQEMMTQAAQEAYRRELQQVRVPNVGGSSPFGKFKR